MHRRHRTGATVSSIALAWALLVATPAGASPFPPPLGPDQPEPSEVTAVESPEEADPAEAPAGTDVGDAEATEETAEVQDTEDTEDTEEAQVKPGRGAPVIATGQRGRKVKVVQVRLQRVGVRDMPVTGLYGQETIAQVKRFQKKAGFARSGVLDAGTLAELTRRTGAVDRFDLAAGENRPYGGRLPASCLKGRVVCVDKRALAVRWVVDGVVKQRLDARFGSDATPTREGVFAITRKSRDHVSSLYDSSMPFALFFDGGQAVHYSPDFASRGYSGASHGCVNTRDYTGMKALYGRADVGDRVVVYRSRAAK